MAAAVCVLVALGVSCSGGSDEEPSAAPATATTTATSVPDDQRIEVEVKADFRRFFNTFRDVITTYPVNADDPRLAMVATGDALARYRAGIQRARDRDGVYRGESSHEEPEVTVVSPTEATVRVCYVDTLALYEQASGRQLEPPEPTPAERTFSLTKEDGRWRVALVGSEEVIGCGR